MRLTITYRGVPVGAAVSRRHDVFPDGVRDFTYFRPLPGYSAIRPTLRLASEAFHDYGFPGPVTDPAWAASEAAKALQAGKALWNELELLDPTGRPVAGRVELFLEVGEGGEADFWVLWVSVEAAGAAEPSAIRWLWRADGAGHEPPAA